MSIVGIFFGLHVSCVPQQVFPLLKKKSRDKMKQSQLDVWCDIIMNNTRISISLVFAKKLCKTQVPIYFRIKVD